MQHAIIFSKLASVSSTRAGVLGSLCAVIDQDSIKSSLRTPQKFAVFVENPLYVSVQ